MKPLKLNMLYVLLLAFWLVGSLPVYGQSSITADENIWQQQWAQWDSLRQQLTWLEQQSDSLAVKIADLKHDKLTYFERKKLEKILQAAQRNAEQREHNLMQQRSVQQKIALLAQRLNRSYAQMIDSLLTVIERSAELPADQLQPLRAQIDFYRTRQRQLHIQLQEFHPSEYAAKVNVESEDLPDEIQVKAQYLRDLADKLWQRVEWIDARLRLLRQEATLRKKMGEFLDDMRLFDQQDEALAISSKTGLGQKGKETTLTDLNAPRAGAKEVEVASPMQPPSQMDARTLSDEGIEENMFTLQWQRQRLLQQADSLSALADKYDQRAKEMRQDLRQPKK